MAPRHESPRTVRIVGTLLAIVWVCAGVAAVFVGTNAERWLLIPIGLAAIWYGVIWDCVSRQGHRLTFREALAPWRLR
jgi:hypothetical protein